tara:strand:+ start:120 stop:245 length:126 start_codon:yes stop_codon:yes gene_type:complete
MQHYNYSLSDIEGMMPWEREIYLTLLLEALRDQAEREAQKR